MQSMRSSRSSSRYNNRRPLSPEPAEPVTLHVYDVGQLEGAGPETVKALNNCLRPFGSGAFHCGVEVFGQEWSFKMEHCGTGVEHYRPMQCEAHSYSESLHMGHTALSKAEVLRLIFSLEKKWPGASYHSLKRNCCHFCDELCVRLGVGHIPAWITHLAGTGAALFDAEQMLEETLAHHCTEEAFFSGSSLLCTCVRQSPTASSELFFTHKEAPVQAVSVTDERSPIPSVAPGAQPGVTSWRGGRYRHAFQDKLEVFEASGGGDNVPCDDWDLAPMQCGSNWASESVSQQEPMFATCGVFGTRSPCCTQARASGPCPQVPRGDRFGPLP